MPLAGDFITLPGAIDCLRDHSNVVLLTSHTILPLPSTTRCSHPAHLAPYPLTPSTRTQALDEFSKKGYCTLLQEGDFTESSVPIPLNYVGVLVGPGGMCIRNLQDNLNVNVVLPKSDAATSGFMQQRRKTHEKVLIAGPRAQVALAKDAIKQLVKFYHSEATHPGQVHKEITDIEAHNYNLIIGQRGSVIKHIQNSFKCRVYIPGEQDENPNVVVVGMPANVANAVKQIYKIIEKATAEWDTEAVDEAAGGRTMHDDDYEEPGEHETWMDEFMYRR